MKKYLIIFMLLLPCLINAREYGDVTAKCIKNYDGDTVTVDIPDYPLLIGKNINVRILGIDTPEIRRSKGDVKELARNAKRFTEHYCKSAKIFELRNMQRDKYFRILANVYVDGENLGDLLIKNNLAKPYDGGAKPEW